MDKEMRGGGGGEERKKKGRKEQFKHFTTSIVTVLQTFFKTASIP
jgi:hypothetical protein